MIDMILRIKFKRSGRTEEVSVEQGNKEFGCSFVPFCFRQDVQSF